MYTPYPLGTSTSIHVLLLYIYTRTRTLCTSRLYSHNIYLTSTTLHWLLLLLHECRNVFHTPRDYGSITSTYNSSYHTLLYCTTLRATRLGAICPPPMRERESSRQKTGKSSVLLYRNSFVVLMCVCLFVPSSRILGASLLFRYSAALLVLRVAQVALHHLLGVTAVE